MSWDLIVILARGSAWLALALSIVGLGYIAASTALDDAIGRSYSRLDRLAGRICGLAFLAAIWVLLAWGFGGGSVNP